MAAQLGYKSPEAVRKKAVDNTRMMLDTMLGLEAANKQAEERKK